MKKYKQILKYIIMLAFIVSTTIIIYDISINYGVYAIYAVSKLEDLIITLSKITETEGEFQSIKGGCNKSLFDFVILQCQNIGIIFAGVIGGVILFTVGIVILDNVLSVLGNVLEHTSIASKFGVLTLRMI
uniref:Uncharacterized protein n=1 Tax=Ulva sp. TM637 TaxID=2496872 RepID=A0A7R6NFD4_9CHLO|nr:hypothetical protein JXX86_mgp26 [Ulva sp. TM637]AZP40104.1 hypothetical protein [Ulva sp. TM637]